MSSVPIIPSVQNEIMALLEIVEAHKLRYSFIFGDPKKERELNA